MAMSARQYLDSLDPKERVQVEASLTASSHDVASYQQALDNWYQAAINAGDPRAVKASGGSSAEEGEGGVADWANAAPSTEWLGKRNPTPRELRRWAHETGQSEDYARYDDRQLAAWIGSSWKGDHFENDFGDRVDKPTESGPNSHAAGAATGEKGAGSAGGGGGGGGGHTPDDNPNDYYNPDDPLQARLMELFQVGGGYMGDVKDRAEQFVPGGGMIWKDKAEEGGLTPPNIAVGVAPGADKTPGEAGGALGNVPPGGGIGGYTTNANPSLVTAAMNAFGPSTPAASTPSTPPKPTLPGAPATPGIPGVPGVPAAPKPPTSPLQQALSTKYTQPNQWWAGGQTATPKY